MKTPSHKDPFSRKKAVAIRYQQNQDLAPVVVAKGGGTVAERIMAIAQEHNIPMYEDPDLVEILGTVELGHFIAPEMYQAVAEVLSFVYEMNEKFEKRTKR